MALLAGLICASTSFVGSSVSPAYADPEDPPAHQDPPPADPDPPLSTTVSAWLGAWTISNLSGGTGVLTANKNAALLNEVDLFWNHLSASGSGVAVTSEVATATRVDSALTLMHGNGYKIMMTVTDGSGYRHLARAIRRPVLRQNTINKLVAMGSDSRVDGIDLDLEGFAFNDGRGSWPSTRAAWIPFIHQLSDALHAQGKLLSVTVPPVNSWKQNSSSGYWVYAANVIAPFVDRVKFMMYDYSFVRPGPIAPIGWVRSRTALYKTAIPASKLQIGVPGYGRDWVARWPRGKKRGQMKIVGKCPVNKAVSTSMSTVSTSGIDTYLAGLGLTRANLVRDRYGELRLNYFLTYTGLRNHKNLRQTTCQVFHEAHLSDSASIIQRARFAKNTGINGISLWHLTGIDQDTYDQLAAL